MNKITIQPTVFVNHPSGEQTYGYRIFDDYDQDYDNTWESIPDDDLEILGIVMDTGGKTAMETIDYILSNQCGLFIGNEWYDWEQIKHLFGYDED